MSRILRRTGPACGIEYEMVTAPRDGLGCVSSVTRDDPRGEPSSTPTVPSSNWAPVRMTP